MRFFYCVFISLGLISYHHGTILNGCRFVQTFYQTHSNIFRLERNQTSLIIRPLYALSNRSISSITMGIIYHLADTYLVPVPLVFECSQNQRIYAPIDCQFTIIDIRSNISNRTSEATRITTVPIRFQENSSLPIRGAYFKESSITLQNCRFDRNENLFTSDSFHIHIQFEQKINSSCQDTCIHPELYECSSITNTCQCRTRHRFDVEKLDEFCIDTELDSNCSHTPERCRRICHISDQIQKGEIDNDCQCPLDMQRILLNNMYHCQSTVRVECISEKPFNSCPISSICQQSRCVQLSIFSFTFVLIGLLMSALVIIIILAISLIRIRSTGSIKFIHSYGKSMHSNNLSPILNTRLSSLSISSSSKSMNNTFEKYTKIDFFE